MPFSKPPALPVRLGKALPLQREFVNVHVYVLVLVNEGKRIRGGAGFLQSAGDNRCQTPERGKSAVNEGGCYGNENVPAGPLLSSTFTSTCTCTITGSIAPFRGFPHTTRYGGGW